MTREDCLIRMIEHKGYSVRSFAIKVGIPYMTLRTALVTKRLGGMAVDSVIAICRELGISVESLNDCYPDGEKGDHAWTPEELLEIEKYKKFIRMQRSEKSQGNRQYSQAGRR